MDNPLHSESGSETYWTTVNTSEAIPGVVTPLCWTFWGPALERSLRGSFVDLGVLERSHLAMPDATSERFIAIFCGRVAANVDLLRSVVGDRMPGTTADAMEHQLLGGSRPEAPSNPTRRRYPVVAARMPVATALLGRRLRRLRRETDAWWQAVVFGSAPSPDRAREILGEAAARFEAVMRPHSFSSFVCQGAYDQVTQLAERAGRPGLERRLISGYGGLEETRLAVDLWEVSRERLELDEFVRRHGYHGPREGEPESRSWREDRRPLEEAVTRYAGMDEDQDPQRNEEGRVDAREALERELLSSASRWQAPLSRLVLASARRYVPLREVGKAAFLQAIDGARFAARAIAADLTDRGLLDDPEDAFYLTLDELQDPKLSDARQLAAERRALRERYRGLELPDAWTGNPKPHERETSSGDESHLTGVGASAGVHEGIARVITDPDTVSVDEGDIVVCETTDPSWALIFVSAGALVIDIGGPISHGAIVAREMGIPCVINTRTGTRVIADGDRLRVDGDAGTVEILERAPELTGAA
jgi:pyruvate,water dikinase